MSLLETLAKHMLVLPDSSYNELLNFLDAVEIFNSTDDKRKISINKDYYDLLKIKVNYWHAKARRYKTSAIN